MSSDSERLKAFALVIFDCDGVLVDSETLATRVFVEMAAELGVSLDLEQSIVLMRGIRLKECIGELERRLGRSLPDSFVPDYRNREAATFRRELRAIEDVRYVLDRLRTPSCVASSSPAEKIRLSLEITGLFRWFEGRLFSAYDVGAWKPDPGLFLHAARTMGVLPSECAVIEDSIVGVKAGVAAGMKVFGFAVDPAHGSALRDVGAQVFSSMRDLPALLGC